MSVPKSDGGAPIYPTFQSPSVTDDTLTAANSPYVIDVKTALGGGSKRGNRGWLENNSSTNFTVEIASGGTSYQTSFTLRSGRNIALDGMEISSIRLTRLTADATFQCVVW